MLALNPISLLYIIVIFNGAFFTIALLFSSADRRHLAYLLILLAVLTLIAVQAIVDTQRWYIAFPYLSFLVYPLALLIGPLFYLFVRARVLHESFPQIRQLLHFIPFAAAVFYLRSGIFASWDTKIKILQGAGGNSAFAPFSFMLMTFKVVLNLTYLVLAWRLIGRYRERHAARLTRQFISTLLWMERLTLLVLFIWPVYYAAGFISFVQGVYRVELDYLLYTSFAMIIHAVAYIAIRKPSAIVSNDIPVFEREKYARSGLSDTEATELMAKLSAQMQEQKRYRDSNLTLPELANYLHTSPHILSQLFSQRLQSNFNDFVNEYRVEEACQKLLDPGFRQFTNLAIAFEVGFGSKASFNRAFKKVVGKTPTAYLREYVTSASGVQ